MLLIQIAREKSANDRVHTKVSPISLISTYTNEHQCSFCFRLHSKRIKFIGSAALLPVQFGPG